jgi:uncharacterized protein (DUF427 family)
MRAIWNGTVIAESADTVEVEGNHYFPRASLDDAYVLPSDTTSVCGWKGTANYLSLQVGDATNRDAVWYYADPKPSAAQIANRVAFWRGVQIVE